QVRDDNELPKGEEISPHIYKAILRVNPDAGLFFFVSSYRLVPLAQQYIGITEPNFQARNELRNEICYRKFVVSIKQGHQLMVFVHSRKDTGKTADKLWSVMLWFGHPRRRHLRPPLAVSITISTCGGGIRGGGQTEE
ncbi:hypothetical protein Tco_0475972, partial [Tanacetum coccineum]